MKLKLHCTAHGLVPLYDEDYEEKKRLKVGKDYEAEIKLADNTRFLGKYMTFMKVSFSCLPQRVQDDYFGGRWENWRNELELVAGSYEAVFSLETKKMEHRHKSIAFGRMPEEEREQLYERVKNCAWSIIGKYVTPEIFERKLIDF
jgi:hypothetical protein